MPDNGDPLQRVRRALASGDPKDRRLEALVMGLAADYRAALSPQEALRFDRHFAALAQAAEEIPEASPEDILARARAIAAKPH